MKQETKFKQTEIGKIPEDWEVKSVNEVSDIFLGGTPKTTEKEYWDGDIKWASAKDVSNCKSRYINKTERTITQKGIDNSAAKILPKNTVVVTSRGTVGGLALLSAPMSFNQTCYGLKAKQNTDPLFLYYKLKSQISRLASVSYGTVFDTITMRTFDELKMSFPGFLEQQSIAKILSDLDSKIELNQQMNKTLEAIGQAIFKRWFVDFEFPNEEGKPYKSSGGAMVDSEMGKIPKGWIIKSLPEVAIVVDCLHSKKPEETKTGKILLQFYNLSEFHSIDLSHPYFVSDKDYKIWTRNITVSDGDILFTNAGRQAISKVPYWFKGGIGRNITAVRATKLNSVYILEYFLSPYGVKQIIENTDTGTIFSSLNVKGIRKLKILIPPTKLIEQYSEIANKLCLRIEKNLDQAYKLRQIRDSLLPKLMSGKIRVFS